MEKLELENLREQTVSLLNQIKSKDEYIAQLETIPLIAKYNAYLYDKEKLQEEYQQKREEYLKLYQQDCPHPLWYFLRELSDGPIPGFTCKCIRCEQEDNVLEYGINASLYEKELENGKLIYALCGYKKPIDIPYEVIRQEFLELEEAGYSLEEIKSILYSKYTRKDIELSRRLKMAYVPKCERSK